MRELGLGIQVFGSGINDSFRVHFLRGPRHLNLTRCLKKIGLGSSRFLLDPVQVNNSNICKIYVNCYITRRIGFVSRTKILKLGRNTKNTRKSNEYLQIFKYSNPKFYSISYPMNQKYPKFYLSTQNFFFKNLKFYLKPKL